MNQILYQKRCKCKEQIWVKKKKKRKPKKRRGPATLKYPLLSKARSKVFQIRYEKSLSSFSKLLLNSFRKKYLYCAIDDILYTLRNDPTEQDNLLEILYSPVLSLHNNLSINFFNIWIQEIYINENKSKNKFLGTNLQTVESISYITIKLLYLPKPSIKKKKSLW